MAEIMKKHGFRVGETVTGKSGTDMFSHNVKIHGFEGYGLVDVSYAGKRGLVGSAALMKKKKNKR